MNNEFSSFVVNFVDASPNLQANGVHRCLKAKTVRVGFWGKMHSSVREAMFMQKQKEEPLRNTSPIITQSKNDMLTRLLTVDSLLHWKLSPSCQKNRIFAGSDRKRASAHTHILVVGVFTG